ncbi:MAG TPA: cytochrome D ubiquinol oxidase subunit I, partial [Acetobacteraceae bacterium]|nr:cytochrome D ubiquinol oxidase subunit I [Acetobacteraceae bacterium]
RYNDSAGRLDELNADIVADLQESGEFAPSTTIINGQLAIRVAFVNHRTEMADIDDLLAAIIGKGEKARLF